jgi:hypothetical protein
MQKQLLEHGRLSEAVDADKSVFPITIITEGEGSSGIYRREMLQENAHAFPKGTKSFIDHPKDPNKPWERSLTSIAGKLNEDASFVEEDGVAKLKASLKVDKRWREFVEEYKDVIGLSIYMGAFGEEDPDTGKLLVESFDAEDPYASVDIVVAAGRGGRFDTAIEAYRTIESSLGTTHESNDDDAPAHRTTTSKDINSMEIEELAGKFDVLTEALKGFIADAKPILESLKPREDDGELDLETVTEALVTSELTKRSRKAVLEAVRNGAAVEDAIKEARADEDEFRAELRVQEGFVQNDGGFQGSAVDLGKVF